MKLLTIIVAIGAVNWGLVGTFDFDLVQTLLGTGVLADAAYIFIGLCGLLLILKFCKSASVCRKTCSSCCGSAKEKSMMSKDGSCENETCEDDMCDCSTCITTKKTQKETK